MTAFEPFAVSNVGVERPCVSGYLLGLGGAFLAMTVGVYLFWSISTVPPNLAELFCGAFGSAVFLFAGIVLRTQERV